MPTSLSSPSALPPSSSASRSLSRSPSPRAPSPGVHGTHLAPVDTRQELPPRQHFRIGISTGAVTASSSRSPERGPAIEMEPIRGHRRRKSSIMNTAGFTANAPGRPRAQSLRSPRPNQRHHRNAQSMSVGVMEEPKIFEEGDDDAHDPMLPRNDSSRDSFSDEDLHDDEEMGLTHNDRRRKQKKRRMNTLLDQRIARQKPLSPEEQAEADRDMVKKIATNCGFVLLWYLFSLSISLYNKWMFDENRLNFAFPLFTTSMHMLVQFALSALVLYCVPSLRPGHSSDGGKSRHESEPNTPIMSKMYYLTRIGPCGAATGLDIGLGNTSLKFISLTFYTMCKSSSLAFVLLFAFLFRLETPTWRLVTIIAGMTAGVVLMVFGEVEFKLGGFVLVISAAFFSGFRWGLTQILLLRNPQTSNPFSSIFFLSPIMFLTLIVLAFPVEGFWPLIAGLKTLSEEWGYLTPCFLLFPGCLAFLMTASEFALLQRTSVVTLSIAGIFKEVLTISVASVVFQDTLTLINFIGLGVTLLAIIAYNYIKITKMRQDARDGVHAMDDEDLPPPYSISGSESDHEDEMGESATLLRPSMEIGETMIMSDGDIQTNLLPQHSFPSALSSPKFDEHKGE